MCIGGNFRSREDGGRNLPLSPLGTMVLCAPGRFDEGHDQEESHEEAADEVHDQEELHEGAADEGHDQEVSQVEAAGGDHDQREEGADSGEQLHPFYFKQKGAKTMRVASKHL